MRDDLELDILAYLSQNPNSRANEIFSYIKLIWFPKYSREIYLRVTLHRILKRLARYRLVRKDNFARYSITEKGQRQLARGLLVLELQNTIRSKLRPYSIFKKETGG